MCNGFHHKVQIYLEYHDHSVCPLVGIGTPPLSHQRVCPPPMNQRDSPAGEGVGESQFGRLDFGEKTIALSKPKSSL